MVGAGDSVTHARSGSPRTDRGSTSRGYGNNLVTTGGNGDLGPVRRKDIRYTSSFDGTSGAGPVVAGSVAAVLSYLKATGQPPLDADQLVGLLRSTGTPQAVRNWGRSDRCRTFPAAIATIQGSLPTVSITGPGDDSFDFNSAHFLELTCGTGAGRISSPASPGPGPRTGTNLVTGDRLPTDQPGTHTLTATATNELGLTATGTVTYEVGPGCFADQAGLGPARGAKVKSCSVPPTPPAPAARPGSCGRQAGPAPRPSPETAGSKRRSAP